jgi:hypothetical protein
MDSAETAAEGEDSISEVKRNGSAPEEVPSGEEEAHGYSGLTDNYNDGANTHDDDDDAFGDFVETPASESEIFNGIHATSDDFAAASSVPSLDPDLLDFAAGVDAAPQPPTQGSSETDPANDAALVDGDPATDRATDGDTNGFDDSFGEFEDAPGLSQRSPSTRHGVATSDDKMDNDASTPKLLPLKEPGTHPAAVPFDSGGGMGVESVDSSDEVNMDMDMDMATSGYHEALTSEDVAAAAAGSNQTIETPETGFLGGETLGIADPSAATVRADQDACDAAEVGDSENVGAANALAEDEINVEAADAGELETRKQAADAIKGDRKEDRATAEPYVGDNNGAGSVGTGAEAGAASGLDPSPIVPESDPGEDADADGFGDFGAAPVLESTRDATAAEGGDDDDIDKDGLGDFDAAPVELADGDEALDADDGNVFGDFDAAPVLEQTPRAAAAPVDAEDDDFGDFDAAPSLEQTPGATGPPVDTEDDEFGDFDAAPVLADEGGDDFGDFDSAPDKSDAGYATSLSANSLPQQHDGAIDSNCALVLRAKAMFSQFFRSDSVLDESHPEGISAFDEPPTIAEFLVRAVQSNIASVLRMHLPNATGVFPLEFMLTGKVGE